VVILLAKMSGAVTVGEFGRARHYVVLFVWTMVVAIILRLVADLVGNKAENNVYGVLTVTYYQRLTNKDMAFYRDSHTGYLTTMYRQYLDSALLLCRMYRSSALKIAVSLTAPAIVLMFYSWRVGLLAVVIIIVQAVYMLWASAKVNEYRKTSSEIYRKIGGEVADDLTNIVAYKAAGQEQAALERIIALRKLETKAFWTRRKWSALLDFPRSLVTYALTSLTFSLVLTAGESTPKTVELVVLTITYLFQILRNVGDLPEIISDHDELMTKLEPTLEVLEPTYEDIQDKAQAKSFQPSTAAIDINHLSFRYARDQDSKYIFRDLDIHIAGGEHVGIVGLSGAGKSTLASLLMRFDEVTDGEILVDGVNIREVSQASLRRKIAYVPQESVLFHRTIRENIAYHHPGATDSSIRRAAKAAHADEFIHELPNGYDTMVGERGVKLSGGQKQRVVIARAVLKDAAIILFDEATSALDSHSEHLIQQALPEIIGKHTAIIIAHRLSTVAKLDRIIVMHNGKIEEQGTHQQLLRQKGRYYSLWQRQTTETA
jgi:ATP-binding cassette subfamily B protein